MTRSGSMAATPSSLSATAGTSFSLGLSYSPRWGGGPPAAPATPDN